MHGVLVGTPSHPRAARLAHANRRRRYGAAVLRAGVDAQGRFVGPRDIERAVAHFWRAPHRRGSAPIVRSDPVFHHALNPTPRRSRVGLEAEDFRRMHAMRQEGKTQMEIAAHFNVSRRTICFHLAGSPAMRAALAAGSSLNSQPSTLNRG